MKKIFTTLAAALLVAVSANAKMDVTYEGQPLENGAVITLTNDDFEYEHQSFPEYNLEMYSWTAECNPIVMSSSKVHFYLKSTIQPIQFCPGGLDGGIGNCFNPQLIDNDWIVDVDFDLSEFIANMHLVYDTPNLPDATETAEMTITNQDGDKFTYTVKFVTTDTSGVDEIMASEANIAGIYDLQGRRVRDDYRGVAIVVYDNGKAVKQVIK